VIGVAKRKIVYPHLTGGGFLFIFRVKKQHAGALTLVVGNNFLAVARNFRDLIESDDRESEKTRLGNFSAEKLSLRLPQLKNSTQVP